jgi:hypothetical protein
MYKASKFNYKNDEMSTVPVLIELLWPLQAQDRPNFCVLVVSASLKKGQKPLIISSVPTDNEKAPIVKTGRLATWPLPR